MRDITLEETVYFKFTSRAFATGIPTTLAGTPVLSVLESNNATPITAGVSVSVDRAAVTGLNEATIVATAANGYEAGKSYGVYISTGTVGGVSVVGEVVAEFTVQAEAAFKRLGAPAGVSVSADVAALDGRIPAALVSGRMDASVGAMAANVMTAAAAASDLTTELQSGLATAAALATAQSGIDDIPTNAELATAFGTADDAVLAQVALVKAKTDLIPAAPSAVGDIPTAVENADALLDRNMATGADNGSTIVRTVRQALRVLRNKVTIASGTMTVKKEDDSTSSWTAAVTGTAGADPITEIDPA